MTNRTNWMLYGAYCSTGRLILEEALRRGHCPVWPAATARDSESPILSPALRYRALRCARAYPPKPAKQQAGVSPRRWKPGRAIALPQ
jgi:hypothetical protein